MAAGRLMSEIYAKAQKLSPGSSMQRAELALMARELKENWSSADIMRSDITLDTFSNLEAAFSPDIPWTKQILDAIKSIYNAVINIVFLELTNWITSYISRGLTEELLEFCKVNPHSSNAFLVTLIEKFRFSSENP